MISKSSICHQCRNFGICTKAKKGRKVIRLLNEETRQRLEAQYEQPESQDIYKFRKQKAEIPFGHIKRNLSVNSFLLRGTDGVKAEMSILATCFNIARMIGIIGVPALIEKIVA